MMMIVMIRAVALQHHLPRSLSKSLQIWWVSLISFTYRFMFLDFIVERRNLQVEKEMKIPRRKPHLKALRLRSRTKRELQQEMLIRAQKHRNLRSKFLQICTTILIPFTYPCCLFFYHRALETTQEKVEAPAESSSQGTEGAGETQTTVATEDREARARRSAARLLAQQLIGVRDEGFDMTVENLRSISDLRNGLQIEEWDYTNLHLTREWLVPHAGVSTTETIDRLLTSSLEAEFMLRLYQTLHQIRKLKMEGDSFILTFFGQQPC
jgi:hypothetical protein